MCKVVHKFFQPITLSLEQSETQLLSTITRKTNFNSLNRASTIKSSTFKLLTYQLIKLPFSKLLESTLFLRLNYNICVLLPAADSVPQSQTCGSHASWPAACPAQWPSPTSEKTCACGHFKGDIKNLNINTEYRIDFAIWLPQLSSVKPPPHPFKGKQLISAASERAKY